MNQSRNQSQPQTQQNRKLGTRVNTRKPSIIKQMSTEQTLQLMQKELLKKIFTNFLDTWNVLVLDSVTHRIIYVLFSNDELREYNIVNIYLIENNRFQIPSNAIYFISSERNVLEMVVDDLKNDIYESYNFLFIDYLKKEGMKYLTREVNKIGKNPIKKVFDMYLDFFMIQNDMFSTGIANSLTNFNSEKIVNSLFSLFFTLQKKPVILGDMENRHIKEIKEKLDAIVENRDIISDISVQKTLLIIVDRKEDLISPIRHNWNYGGLLNDVLNINQGRIQYEKKQSRKNDENDKNINIKNVVLTLSDTFWQENKNKLLPEVTENIDKKFKKLKSEITKKENKSKEMSDIKLYLEESMKINDEKEYISNHMSLCLELVETVRRRNLDDFYESENMPVKKITEKNILDLSIMDPEDFLRFASILICNENISDEIRQRIYELLNERKIDYSFIDALVRLFDKNQPIIDNEVEESGMKKILSGFVGNVKQMLIENYTLPITETVIRYLDEFVENTDFEYENVEKIVVYSLGGSTFVENSALKNLEERIEIPILFGGTEILNFKTYAEQIKKL